MVLKSTASTSHCKVVCARAHGHDTSPHMGGGKEEMAGTQDNGTHGKLHSLSQTWRSRLNRHYLLYYKKACMRWVHSDAEHAFEAPPSLDIEDKAFDSQAANRPNGA